MTVILGSATAAVGREKIALALQAGIMLGNRGVECVGTERGRSVGRDA